MANLTFRNTEKKFTDPRKKTTLFWILRESLKFFEIFQDLSRFIEIKIFQDLSRFFEIFQDLLRFFKILLRFFKIFLDLMRIGPYIWPGQRCTNRQKDILCAL